VRNLKTDVAKKIASFLNFGSFHEQFESCNRVLIVRPSASQCIFVEFLSVDDVCIKILSPGTTQNNARTSPSTFTVSSAGAHTKSRRGIHIANIANIANTAILPSIRIARRYVG
jgi:hypothetical protein